jgi:hypothetical protein
MDKKCKFCKKGLREINDDWIKRQSHKSCWKKNEDVNDMINYLKVAKYIPANYESPIHLLNNI